MFQVLGLLPIYYVIGTYVLNVFSLGDSLFLGGRWRIDDVHLEFLVTADRMKMSKNLIFSSSGIPKSVIDTDY